MNTDVFVAQPTVGGESVPVGTEGFLDYIVYQDPGGAAVEKSEPLTGDIVGSFTWAGVTYQVTFTQGPDEEPEELN